MRIYSESGELLADWPRAEHRGQWLTNTDHMPAWYSDMRGASVSQFIDKARLIGPCTEKVIRQLFDTCDVPVQGYRKCYGILGLARRYGDHTLEECCRQALAAGKSNYAYLRDTISVVAEEMEEEAQVQSDPADTVFRARESTLDSLLARTAAIISKGGGAE